MSQHATLTLDRWKTFRRDQQILMIGNEMNRASRLQVSDDNASRGLAYERILKLVDLTIEAQPEPGLRRELLRWRDLIAAMYVRPETDASAHRDAFRALLLLDPIAARQIPFVLR
jgi:hypothetical protein